jgi:hypothetical protein
VKIESLRSPTSQKLPLDLIFRMRSRLSFARVSFVGTFTDGGVLCRAQLFVLTIDSRVANIFKIDIRDVSS